jgi:hypothetical protein
MVTAAVADSAGFTAGEGDADGCCALSLLAGAAAKAALVGGDAVEAGADIAEELTAEFPDDSAEVLESVFTEDETEAVGANDLRGVSSWVVSSFSEESGVNEMLVDFTADAGASLSGLLCASCERSGEVAALVGGDSFTVPLCCLAEGAATLYSSEVLSVILELDIIRGISNAGY